MGLRVILTGTTGMVGEGVLLECLEHPDVEQVLVINRRAGGMSHRKLREVIHGDFLDLGAIESQMQGYDACFFCLGMSSVRASREEYRRITYDLTLNFARVLARSNPEMTFCYVTGMGTDNSGGARLEWARVKGETENAVLALFKHAYMFRPGFMKAMPGQRRLKLTYRLLAWVYPIGRAIYPAAFCTLQEVGRAMIHAAQGGSSKRVLEVKDILALAKA